MISTRNPSTRITGESSLSGKPSARTTRGYCAPSQIPNNTGGVSGSGSLSAYLLLILLPMLIGGALLVKRLLQIEPYSFDRWEAPPISSPQKDKD